MTDKHIPKVITFSGLPGSGKSTAAKDLAEKLDYTYFSVGMLLRQLAKEQGKTLAEIGKEAEDNIEIDKLNDKRMVDFVRDNKKVVIDGRIAGWILKENGIKSFNILMDASLEVRCDRISNRDGIGGGEAVLRTKERQDSEKQRYLGIYGIDINDHSIYDLVVDTEKFKPNEVLEIILNSL